MDERSTVTKVVLLGDSCVGKTALMRRFIKRTFDEQYRSLGLDFLTKDVKVGNVPVSTQVWDTTGQGRFAKFWPAYYRGAECCVLVFSLTDVGSFESLKTWRAEFLDICRPKLPDEFPFVVVGNKADLNGLQRLPPEWTCIPIGHKADYPCIETSARSGLNVDQCFQIVIRRAMRYKHALMSHRLSSDSSEQAKIEP